MACCWAEVSFFGVWLGLACPFGNDEQLASAACAPTAVCLLSPPPAAAAVVCPQAESLVQHLASDMASEGIEAKTLMLKLKTTAFEVIWEDRGTCIKREALAWHAASSCRMQPAVVPLGWWCCAAG